MRRRRQHGVPVIGALVLLALLAVIAAAIQIAEHLILLAVIAAVAAGAFYLGQLHERRRARPRQVQPRPAWPEEPAAVSALPVATLPLAGYGQDEELTDERPARRADRDSLLADPRSGAHPLRRPV